MKKMVYWTIDQGGVARFATYDPANNSTIETVVNLTPGLNKLIKVSDYGLTEKINKELGEDERVKAQFRLNRSPEARQFLTRKYRLERMKKAEDLSDSGKGELARIEAFYRRTMMPIEKQMREAMENGDTARYEERRKFLEQRLKNRAP